MFKTTKKDKTIKEPINSLQLVNEKILTCQMSQENKKRIIELSITIPKIFI